MKNILFLILISALSLPLVSGCTFKEKRSVSAVKKEHKLKVASGHIERYHLSSKYIDSRNVDIWLPPDYSSDKQYSVLYMHDGQMLFDSTKTWNNREWKVDETIGQLLKNNKIQDVMVVGIWNNNELRHAEYFPEKAVNYLSKQKQDSLIPSSDYEFLADNYLRFLVTELKPFVDSTYSTHKDMEHTYLMGSSMGGLISIYGISEYPDVFGGAACLSSHWIGTMEANDAIPNAINQYLKENLPSPDSHKIYFDHGTETLDANYPPYQKLVDRTMKGKGYNSDNWMSREFPGDDHSEKSWSNRLHIPLTFLLKKED